MLKFFNAMRSRRPYLAPLDVDQEQALSNELPPDLIAAIDGCYVMERSPDQNGAPRVVIQFDGACGGWVHGAEATRAAIVARWPSLSDAQLKRALRFVDSTVENHLRPTRLRKRRNGWVNSWREDDIHA